VLQSIGTATGSLTRSCLLRLAAEEAEVQLAPTWSSRTPGVRIASTPTSRCAGLPNGLRRAREVQPLIRAQRLTWQARLGPRRREGLPALQVILGHAGLPLSGRASISRAGVVRSRRSRRFECRVQDIRLGWSTTTGRSEHPSVGASLHRSLWVRSRHVRDQLAGRRPLQHLPPSDRAYRTVLRWKASVERIRKSCSSERGTVLSYLVSR